MNFAGQRSLSHGTEVGHISQSSSQRRHYNICTDSTTKRVSQHWWYTTEKNSSTTSMTMKTHRHCMASFLRHQHHPTWYNRKWWRHRPSSTIATCQHNGVAPGDYWCYKPKQLTTQQVQRCTLHDSSTSAFCLRQCNREWMRFSTSTSTVEEPVPADCFVTWFDSTSYDIVERIVDGGNFWGTSPPLWGNLNRQQMRPGLATQQDNLKAIQGSTGLVDSHLSTETAKLMWPTN